MPNQRANTFRINAKNFYLTYPQCPATKDSLLTFLTQLRPTVYCVVSAEQHADGTPHLHALVQYVDQYNCRNQRAFDITFEGSTYHPNIQNARSVSDVRRYVTKDGDFIEQGEFSDAGKRKRPTMGELLSASDTKEAFYEALLEHHSRDFIINNDQIVRWAEKRFRPAVAEYIPEFTSFPNLPPQLTDWFNSNFVRPRPRRPLSLVLVGPSRIGKTEWARSLGSHVFISGMWNADKFKVDYDYIVLDDFDFSFMASKPTLMKGFFGSQKTVEVTGKYIKNFTISCNCPVIVCMNEDQYNQEELRTFFNSEWGLANICKVFVQDKLY